MNAEELKNNLQFEDKKILILGFAREGKDALNFLKKLYPKKVIGVGDREEKKIKGNVSLHFKENYLEAIKDYDVVIRSPGIPMKLLKPYLKENTVLTSSTKIFLENCKGRVIGVTGTKGKSTTSSLIYEMLKSAKLKVHLLGNIGKPSLSLLLSSNLKDIFVYELSSHQLMDVKKSPQVSVFLNLYPEHLDYYESFEEYAAAKSNITKFQSKDDCFVFNPNNKYVNEAASISRAKKIRIKKLSPFFLKAFKQSRLKGDFNELNVSAAVEVAKIFQIKDKNIAIAIKRFKPLEHRLEFAGVFKGISFFNDSLATIPEATIGAIKTFKNLETLITGGFDRGVSFEKLGKEIQKSRIKNLILFPTTGEKILAAVRKSSSKNYNIFIVKDMKEAVRLAFKETGKGKVCLLSCASSSFNLFKDYRERGNMFKKYVKAFGKSQRKDR